MNKRYCNPEHEFPPETTVSIDDASTGVRMVLCPVCWEDLCINKFTMEQIQLLMGVLDD